MPARFRKLTVCLMCLVVPFFATSQSSSSHVFNQNVLVSVDTNGGHLVKPSNSFKNQQKNQYKFKRIHYSGLLGETHLLMNSWQSKNNKPVPKAHNLSLAIADKTNDSDTSKGLQQGFVLPEVGFDVGLLVLEWENVFQKVKHQFNSTWLLNPLAGGQFANKRSQILSIRPMLNSQFLTKGNDLPVRVYYKMEGVSIQLFAKHHESGRIITVLSDEVGMASVPLMEKGMWTLLVEREDGLNKYTSFLNFEVSENHYKDGGAL